MISTATKTLQGNNKTIYVALLSTLTFFLIYFFTFRQFGLIHLFPSLLPGTHKTSLPLCVLPRFATFSHFNYSYT